MLNPVERSLPRALVLDIDNTVYPYEACHRAGLRRAFAAQQRICTPDERSFQRHYDEARATVKSLLKGHAAGHSRLLYFKRMVERQLGRTDADLTEVIEASYWEGYASMLQPDPGCYEFLQRACHEGVRLAWASNFTTARQMWKLRRLGLHQMPAVLVTSEEAGVDKPDPAAVALAMKRLGVCADETVLIGDDAADIGAASALGLTVAVKRRDDSPPVGNYEKTLFFKNWSELPVVLAGVWTAGVYA